MLYYIEVTKRIDNSRRTVVVNNIDYIADKDREKDGGPQVLPFSTIYFNGGHYLDVIETYDAVKEMVRGLATTEPINE